MYNRHIQYLMHNRSWFFDCLHSLLVLYLTNETTHNTHTIEITNMPDNLTAHPDIVYTKIAANRAAAPAPAAATPLPLANGVAAPEWLVDDADEEAVPVAVVVAAELVTAEEDDFAEVTALDAALALEVAEPPAAAVEVPPEAEVAAPVAEQPAALGRAVIPAPAQSCSANWIVAVEVHHQY